MHNVVSLIGNLGADPDIRYAPSGTAIANMRLAVNDHRKDSNGNAAQQTYWFNVVAFGKTAEVVGQYCSKGNKIAIAGKLVQREWEDGNGNKRSTVEIRVDSVELLGSSQNGQSQAPSQGQARQQQTQQRTPPPPPPQGENRGYQPPPPPCDYAPPDDGIPF